MYYDTSFRDNRTNPHCHGCRIRRGGTIRHGRPRQRSVQIAQGRTLLPIARTAAHREQTLQLLPSSLLSVSGRRNEPYCRCRTSCDGPYDLRSLSVAHIGRLAIPLLDRDSEHRRKLSPSTRAHPISQTVVGPPLTKIKKNLHGVLSRGDSKKILTVQPALII